MRFRQYLTESNGPKPLNIPWGYMGPLTPILGGDKPERLNYGTSSTTFKRNAMLYVKIDPREGAVGALAKRARKEIESWGLECLKSDITAPATSVSNQWDDEMTVDGGMFYKPINANWQCKRSNKDRKHYTSVADTGEMHVTIGQYWELKPLFEQQFGKDFTIEHEVEYLNNKTLGGTPLFDHSGQGIEMPVKVTRPSKIVYGLAPSFEGQPIIALAFVECPTGSAVREAVGLNPVQEGYLWHITIATAFPVDSQLPDGRELKTTNKKVVPRDQRDSFRGAKERHNTSYLDFKTAREREKELMATPIDLPEKDKKYKLPENFVYLGESVVDI